MYLKLAIYERLCDFKKEIKDPLIRMLGKLIFALQKLPLSNEISGYNTCK